MGQTLLYRRSPLAPAEAQRRFLAEPSTRPAFEISLQRAGAPALQAGPIQVLQVNVGKVCNQTCRHCHVDAGPERKEVMTRETAEACITAIERGRIGTLDITGGAPELNPQFRWLVTEARARGVHVMDRCNLTVLNLKPQADLAQFLADHQVEVVASLPYFRAGETDRQRGEGVFDESIEGLQRLNALGYGEPGSGRLLNLVHNPVGAFLPARQSAVEQQFRQALLKAHGVRFNALYTITNMPISRYLEYLIDSGNYEDYMNRLVQAFNPATLPGLMCRSMLSVGWDGLLYDCDFNQMLELPVTAGQGLHIRDFDPARLSSRAIATGNHCYGCTAGAGSSCGGAVA